MSLTRDLTRDLTRPLTRDLTSSSGVTSRNLTELVSASTKYFSFPDWVTANNYEVRMKYTPRNFSNLAFILDHPTGIYSRIYINTSGHLVTRHSSITKSGTVQTLTLDEENLIYIIVSGTSLKGYVNNVLTIDTTVTPVAQTFKFSGKNFADTLYVDGIISEIELSSNGVLERYYKANESWAGASTVLADSSGSGQNGTAFNITNADAESFTLNTAATPDQWENGDQSVIIPIAY